MKKIAMFVNIKTGRPICYMINKFKFTLNPNEVPEINWNGFHDNMYRILNDIYNGDDSGNMTEHEYYHIWEEYFKGINKKDVMPTMIQRDEAVVYTRMLKILKLKSHDKSGI